MTLNATYQAKIDGASPQLDFWLEIEGLPLAYGSWYSDATFFAGRAVAFRRKGIRDVLAELPSPIAQEVRPLDGNASIGQLTVKLIDDATDRGIDNNLSFGRSILEIATNGGRSDRQLFLGCSNVWVTGATHAVGDIVCPPHRGGTNQPWMSTSSSAGATDALGIHWYKATAITTGVSAAGEPVWPTGGATVVDGGVTWTDQGRIPIDGLSSWTVFPYAGTANNADYPTGGGYLYIGRETVWYTSRTVAPNGGGFFSIWARGMFQLQGYTQSTPHAEGDTVTPYPLYLATRRAVLYAVGDRLDANKVARFSGTIRDPVRMTNEATVLELSLETVETEFKGAMGSQGKPELNGFRTQRVATLSSSMRDRFDNWNNPGSGVPPPASDGTTSLSAASTAGQVWTAGEYVFLWIGHEVVKAVVVTGRTATDQGAEVKIAVNAYTNLSGGRCGRGLFNTPGEQHVPGETVRELMVIRADDASTNPESTDTKYTNDHPLYVARTLLESTGTGLNGSLDTLAAGWGAGVDKSRIDGAAAGGIENLKTFWLPGARHCEVITKPFDIKAKIAEILRPWGCYGAALLNDLWTIRRLNPPTPLSTPVALDTNSIQRIVSWDSNVANVVGRVVFYCNWDPLQEKFGTRLQYDNPEAQTRYANLFKTVTVEAKGMYTGDAQAGAGGFAFPNLGTDAETVGAAYAGLVFDRYAKNCARIEIECDYGKQYIEVGDLVTVTESQVTPNQQAGARGLTGQTFEVVSKKVDDLRACVVFTLDQMYYAAQYRLISPCASIVSVSVNTLTVSAHAFSETTDQADGLYFLAGDRVRVMSADLLTQRGTAIVQAGMTGTTVILDAAPGGIVAGDILLLNNFTTQAGARTNRNAFVANSANPPLVGGLAAHTFSS